MIEQNRAKTWPYLIIENKMLRDKEFYQELSAKAQLLFIYLRSAYDPYNSDSLNKATGKIQVKMSYSFISKINGFHSYETVRRAFQELIDKGWIEVTERGGKFGGKNAYSFPNQYGMFKNGKKKKSARRKKSV